MPPTHSKAKVDVLVTHFKSSTFSPSLHPGGRGQDVAPPFHLRELKGIKVAHGVKLTWIEYLTWLNLFSFSEPLFYCVSSGDNTKLLWWECWRVKWANCCERLCTLSAPCMERSRQLSGSQTNACGCRWHWAHLDALSCKLPDLAVPCSVLLHGTLPPVLLTSSSPSSCKLPEVRDHTYVDHTSVDH